MERSTKPLRERNKAIARETVLDAAERLLYRGPGGDFSMRALAVEAGVGFATPFNHFGNKNAIMQGLSTRLIDRMHEHFQKRRTRGNAVDRVLAMGNVAVAVLLENPAVAKVVVGSLGVVDAGSPAVRAQSRALWSVALGDFAGISRESRPIATSLLAEQLALVFRGCLSFWIAGELSGERLEDAFAASALSLMLAFCEPELRPLLLERVRRRGRYVLL